MMPLSPLCPVCSSPDTGIFFERTGVPVHQHLIFKQQTEAIHIRRGDLILGVCNACGFVFNTAFNAGNLSYDQHYDNTQLSSPYFQKYVDGLVQGLIDQSHVRNARIVEIGCGKGDFLRALVTAQGANNTGIGFDPSYIGPDSDLEGRLTFERRFYDERCADVIAEVIICRHVIEHIPNPIGLLKTIRMVTSNSPDARLFFETPDIEWILRRQVIWDVFYEHCSYFSAESLATAFGLAGFHVSSVSHAFGGQYLWLEASNHPLATTSMNATNIPMLARQFAESYTSRVQKWHKQIQMLAASHTLALWGAGAKGVTFANLSDLQRDYFAAVVDLNPAKQGGYLPGTGHPIISPQQLIPYGIDCVLSLNSNYASEIQALLTAESLPVQLINMDTE